MQTTTEYWTGPRRLFLMALLLAFSLGLTLGLTLGLLMIRTLA